MNSKKIAFIICVNDLAEFSECRFYLDRLNLPDGYEKDIISIEEAPSMTAGYNAGMQSTDAKYKIYLHQDVFIIHRNFISDILHLFQKNPDIGLAGCIGTARIKAETLAVTSWDTGNIYHNCTPMHMNFPYPVKGQPAKAAALDGLLLATQYDIPWREDLMDGWDFYDIAQCMEFHRKGYDIAIPYQSVPWCYHDNQYSNMKHYHDYRQKFINEYFADSNFQLDPESDRMKEYSELKEDSRKAMESLIRSEKRTEIHEIFQKAENRGYLHLREYELIADIDRLEQEHHIAKPMWETGMDLNSLLNKLRFLKFQIKRLEYLADCPETVLKRISVYSDYAKAEVCSKYVYDTDRVIMFLQHVL